MNWDIDPMFRIIYYPFVSIYQLNCSSFFPIGWSTNWESMNSWCGPGWIIVTCKEIEKITITLITPMFFPSFFYTFGFWFEILCIHGHVEMMTYQSLRSFICSTLFEARTTCSSVFFRGKTRCVIYIYSNCLRLQRSKKFLELLQGFHESICVSCEGISNKNG